MNSVLNNNKVSYAFKPPNQNQNQNQTNQPTNQPT